MTNEQESASFLYERVPPPLSGRSRKRAVSSDRSDPRITFSPSGRGQGHLGSSTLPHHIQPPKLNFRSFHPPTASPANISFTSTAGGGRKWWKSKLGWKKLVNSVRKRQKTKKTSESEPTSKVFELPPGLESLKKRRLDFEKEFIINQRKVEGRNMSDMSCSLLSAHDQAEPGTENGIVGKEKDMGTTINTASLDDDAPTRVVGPGGEVNKSVPNSPGDCNLQKTKLSASAMYTESDASFVICDLVEESVGKAQLDLTDLDKSKHQNDVTESKVKPEKAPGSEDNCNSDSMPSKSDSNNNNGALSPSPENEEVTKTETPGEVAPVTTKAVAGCQQCSCCHSHQPIPGMGTWSKFAVLVAAVISIFLHYYVILPYFFRKE